MNKKHYLNFGKKESLWHDTKRALRCQMKTKIWSNVHKKTEFIVSKKKSLHYKKVCRGVEFREE